MLREMAEVIGRDLNFSVYNRGLLLAALAQKSEFLRAAEKFRVLSGRQTGMSKRFENTKAKSLNLSFGHLIYAATRLGA